MEFELTRNRDGFTIAGSSPYILLRALANMEPGEYTLKGPITNRAPRRRSWSPILKEIVKVCVVSLPMAVMLLLIIYKWLVG